ncbi:MAG: hypothetical protein NVS1B7_3800 [Candidatus Saccharimonadales bacterium]
MSVASRSIGSIISSVLILGLPAIAWLNKETIYDKYRLYNYQPPVKISQLATDDSMTPHSRKLFYVYHPSLEDKTTFNGHCTDSEKTIVLGCYSLHKGIYLYNINDPRLDGVVQVTAAHEMLHAAYDRLSPTEKKRVDSLVLNAYASVTDKRIKATIDDYKKVGADTTNELHSILGTEVRELPPELESYYSQYFSNRRLIVSYSEKYEAAFSERHALGDRYNAQLASLKQQIDSLNSELGQQRAALTNQYNQLQNERSSVSDVPAFNAKVQAFNNSVNSYNAKAGQVSILIDQYNAIVDKYKALVGEEQQLYKAIDSRPTAVQSQ